MIVFDQRECYLVKYVFFSDVDILWTEKYQPTCAADILGNTKQVKKVWTWLKEWKDRTDMEIKRLKKQLMKEARRGKITKEEAKKSKFFSLFTCQNLCLVSN